MSSLYELTGEFHALYELATNEEDQQAKKNSNNGELFDPLVFVSDLDKVFIVAGIPLEKEKEVEVI